MKSYIRKNKGPDLVTYLELNQKFGYGYQGRMVMNGQICGMIDDAPYTLADAYTGCVDAIKTINENFGYTYDPYEVIKISSDAVQVNKSSDEASAAILEVIQDSKYEAFN